MKKIILVLSFLVLLIPFTLTGDTIERRGCCSWHGGVCGCDYSTGKQLCCDGTLSPTCYCGE